MFKITKAEDGLHAVKTIEFDFGKLREDEVSEDGKTTKVVVGMVVPSMIKYYEGMLLQNTHDSISTEDYKELLDTYFQLRLADFCGIQEQPLKLENGKVLGLKDNEEYEFQEEEK